MPSLNKVFLMGNLTRDPELRYTPAGLGVATFNMAVNTPAGKDENGNIKTETLFVDVVVFGRLAEAVGEFLTKGFPVFVEGRLRYRTWEDSNGIRRSKHEVLANKIQFLSALKNMPAEEEERQSNFMVEISGDNDVPF
ncbi:single-stranded DNA-binding protein [Hippea maritima]|uniref:Single-stranded DNA-binding protein n=1 Tax=Hippea maritima (strain ATCC 700847 / DSM 10411 / MH2) TaxID=760142 RepID=F2LV66_HIPMA|nr:single-stranded DNA-binding protein [Hippea maritima]AEA33650.1 single-strand binding protein [Hippea maritima DSM 10411]